MLTKKLTFLVLVAAIVTTTAQGIYPLPSILQKIFKRRKPSFGIEVVLKHRVAVGGALLIEIQEQIVSGPGSFSFLYQVEGFEPPIRARLATNGYLLEGRERIHSRSNLLLQYLAAGSEKPFQEALILEGFIRSNQLMQFNPDFVLEGDPRNWKPEDYLKHEGIYLHRLGDGIAIAVRGTESGSTQRTVYFDRALKGVMRLEWVDGDQTVAWEFSKFRRSGSYPTRMSFEKNGIKVITTELLKLGPITSKKRQEVLSQWRAAKPTAVPEKVQASLKLLLGYR